MAISQTMSNPSDWIYQPYQSDYSQINQIETSPTTTVSTVTTAAPNTLSPEQGRVAKPTRRRSRASRRTPTTLLNTDTTNFRAMVQHFTGGPAALFAANRGAPLNYMEHVAANAAAAPPGGFNVQHASQVQNHHHHVFMMNNLHGGGGGDGGGVPPESGNRFNYDQFIP